MTDTFDHSQRVVFVGLRRMSDDRNLIVDGFRHWMKEHSHSPLNIESVVTSLVSYLGLDSGQKKSLMLSMHVAASKMKDDLPEVPKSLVDRAAANSTAPSQVEDIEVESSSNVRKASPPHCAVTKVYLQTLAQLLQKHDGEAFGDLREILSKESVEGISKTLQQSITHWAESGLSGLEIADQVTEADCKVGAHEIYLLMTEVIGPMDTDNLVNSAIQTTKSLEEANRFHPRLLL